MSNNVIIVNIQNPCDEKWNEMQPHDRGKFCMQCSKEVIDFTKLDNTEIIKVIEQSKGRICGRMFVSQLNRPIEIQSKKKRSKLYKALTAIFLIGSTGSVFATNLSSTSNDLNVSKSESNFKRINLKQTKADSLKDIIKGQVLTEFEEPIPGADIFIKELNLQIETDLEGNFTMVIPKDYEDNTITILITYLGFDHLETTIYRYDLFPKTNFYLKESEEMWMGEVVIYKKRWWQFWKRF